MIEQLPVTALHEWLADGGRAAPLILDVREPWEHAICRIEQAQLLPMQEIPERCAELPRDRDIVVVCHHGVRSRFAARFLAGSGFAPVFNLTGGVEAWAADADPTLARY